MLPATGSTMIAATSPALDSSIADVEARSLYSASNVSLAVPWVTPGELGVPKVTAPLPA